MTNKSGGVQPAPVRLTERMRMVLYPEKDALSLERKTEIAVAEIIKSMRQARLSELRKMNKKT